MGKTKKLNESKKAAKNTQELPPFFRIHQAAKYLNVSEKTIRRLLAESNLIGFKVGKKIVRIPRHSVLEYIERQVALFAFLKDDPIEKTGTDVD